MFKTAAVAHMHVTSVSAKLTATSEDNMKMKRLWKFLFFKICPKTANELIAQNNIRATQNWPTKL